MDADEKTRLRGFCAGSRKAGSWPNGAMLTLLDALDAAERERDELRDRLRAMAAKGGA